MNPGDCSLVSRCATGSETPLTGVGRPEGPRVALHDLEEAVRDLAQVKCVVGSPGGQEVAGRQGVALAERVRPRPVRLAERSEPAHGQAALPL